MKNISFQELSFKKEEPSSYADFLSKKAKGFNFETFFSYFDEFGDENFKEEQEFFLKTLKNSRLYWDLQEKPGCLKEKKIPIAIYNTSLASVQSENAQHRMYVGEIDSVISETILKSLFYDFKLFIEEDDFEKVKKELILVKFEENGIPYSESTTMELDVFLNLGSFFKLLKEKGFFVDLNQKSEKRFKV